MVLRSRASSQTDSTLGERYFISQDLVDEFVKSYPNSDSKMDTVSSTLCLRGWLIRLFQLASIRWMIVTLLHIGGHPFSVVFRGLNQRTSSSWNFYQTVFLPPAAGKEAVFFVFLSCDAILNLLKTVEPMHTPMPIDPSNI